MAGAELGRAGAPAAPCLLFLGTSPLPLPPDPALWLDLAILAPSGLSCINVSIQSPCPRRLGAEWPDESPCQPLSGWVWV